MKVTLTRVTEDPVAAIEEAASNCYDSSPTGGKIMNACYKSGHHSVLEFCDFTFHVEGISRALSHQLVRHRLASYAQRSQRYCEENGFEYVIPNSIKSNKDAFEEYVELMYTITDTYGVLLELGIPAEDARMVLPNACTTVIEIKMNLRTLIHFMNERLCTCAQWEIRELARLMKKCIVERYPQFEEYLVPKCERFGKEFAFCTESKQRREGLKCNRHPTLSEIFEAYCNLSKACPRHTTNPKGSND
jgi:thymidylate synthase (FAD)